jgi:hypothetical protein
VTGGPPDCCFCQVMRPTDMAALTLEWAGNLILIGRTELTDKRPANDDGLLAAWRSDISDCPF